MRHALGGEPFRPPIQGLLAGDTKRGADDGVGAAALRRGRPVEKGDVGAGGAETIGVEQVIGRNVVLVHRLLDQPKPQHAGVEVDVPRGVRRDGGEVVDAFQLSISALRC